MPNLTTAQVKALKDKLGDNLADFFVEVHGVETDDAPEDDNDDGDKL
jgi:hypothetical protein